MGANNAGDSFALPEVLCDLPDAHEVVEQPLPISGSFVLEIFADCAALTLALTIERVPCMRPWDVAYSDKYNVLTHGEVLNRLVVDGRLVAVHCGTPCQSMTWGRLPQLRSWSFPSGLSDLRPVQQLLVTAGNALAAFTMWLCAALHAARGYFSIENPCLSWLWALPGIRDLYSDPSTIFTVVHYADYGTGYVKPTAILHNTPCLHRLWRPRVVTCPQIILRGWLWFDGRKVARTALASRYPPSLARGMAQLMKESLVQRETAMASGDDVPFAHGALDDGYPLPDPGEGGSLGAGSSVDPAPDVMDPFVFRGLGSPKGMTVSEHIEWAMSQHHVFDDGGEVEAELARCLDFEISHDVGSIDHFRMQVLERIRNKASELASERLSWQDSAAPEHARLAHRIHGPLVAWLVSETCFEDASLVKDLHAGFPYVGELPPSATSAVRLLPKRPTLETVDTLRTNRKAKNLEILGKLKPSEWEHDMLESAVADMEFGALGPLTTADELDLEAVTVSRRLAVREERTKGWRTRIVDHKTESGINYAIAPADRIRHDNVDTLVTSILVLMRAGVEVELWKRDVSQAFRRLPIWAGHLDLTWVVFLAYGVAYAAQHRGMPFGTISAVYAWHRVGGFLLCVVRRLFLAPGCRYTDDFFGCGRKGVRLTGGHCLSVIADLVGMPCDPLKDAHFVTEMVVLGALVVVDKPRAGVSAQVAPDKAVKWTRQLHEMISEGECDPQKASKFAGRLSFAVTACCDKVGRAFVKPFYAQANAPLAAHRVSMRLKLAALWWMAFLALRVPPFRPCALHTS